MAKKTNLFELESCELKEHENSIFVRLKGSTKGIGIPDIVKFEEVQAIIGTLGAKEFEKIMFSTMETTQTDNFTDFLLHFEKKVMSFEELTFTVLSYNFGPEEFTQKLYCVENNIEAAKIGAAYATQNDIAAVKINYFNQQKTEGVVKIINYNVYKKVSPTNTSIVVRMVQPNCLLLKSH